MSAFDNICFTLKGEGSDSPFLSKAFVNFVKKMGKLIIIIMGLTYSSTMANTKAKLALFNIVNVNIPERDYQLINKKIRLNIHQLNKFEILSYESILQSLESQNRPLNPLCYKSACLKQMGRFLPKVNYLLTGKLYTDQKNITLVLKLFSNKHKQTNFESFVELPHNDSSLQIIADKGVERFQKDLRHSMAGTPNEKTLTSKSNKTQLWVATGLLAATGAAIAWRDGQLEYQDDNASDIGGVLSHPTELSALRGFYALPSMGAAYKGQGGAGVASVDKGTSSMLNPAGLATLEKEWVNYSFTSLPTGIPSFFLSYAAPYSDNFYQALAVRSEGDELANEITLYASFATNLGQYFRSIHNLRLGVNLKGYFLSVGHGGTGLDRSTGYGYGLGVDVGLQFPLTEKISSGILLRDVYSIIQNRNTLTNREYDEPLPLEFTVGFAYQVTSRFKLAIDGEKAMIKDQVDHVRLGGTHSFFEILHLRLGTHQIMNKENSRYLTFGFGFEGDVENYSMDINYSFEKGVDNKTALSNSHQFSMDIGF